MIHPPIIMLGGTPPAGRPFTAPAWAEWVASLTYRLLHRLGDDVRTPAPAAPVGAAELLRLADAYQATQPSYAADLRAAALQSMKHRGR